MRPALAIFGLLFVAASGSRLSAQDAAAGAATATSASLPAQATLIRDPRTGRLYKQELQTFDQPVTRWQRKVVDRTVATPQTVIENHQVPQTTYVARTEYVMQSRLKGWWNPFTQPTYAYEYVPVTRWVPQTQLVTQQVPTVKMISRTEQIAIDEPIQTTERVQRLVTTEVNPSASSIAAQPVSAPVFASYPASYTPAGYPYSSMQAQPLIARVPILSQQRMLPWQPGTLLTAPASQLRSIVRSNPYATSNQSTYSAPMNVASRPTSGWSRDLNQSGIPATVIR